MDKKQPPLASLSDRLTQYVKEKALRKTPERYEILRIAQLADTIFNIEDLMQLMEKHGAFQVSRGTMFNTMELFYDAGLVIKHSLAKAAHYELRTDRNPKAYTICHQCNSITKVSTSTARLALQNLKVRYFNTEDKLLYIHGTCRICQAKNRRQEARKKKNELNKQDKNKNGKRKS